MNKFLKFALLALTTAAVVPVASADTFAFQFLNANHSGSGSGTVVYDPAAGPNAFLITSGTFTLDGNTASLVPAPLGVPPTVFGSTAYDNVLFSSGTGVGFFAADIDINGILLQNGTFFDNIYKDNGGGYFQYSQSEGTTLASSFSGTLSITTVPGATPEPSSLALLGTGVLSVAGFARRRFVKA